jgi:poly-gamma-glutamate synthesis protein (capsule biosynthesis protein)
MKISIGGDFCITPEFLSNSLFDKDVINLFKNSDFNILNLECPVAEDNDNDKIIKTGPHLRTEEMIFDHLKILNTHAVTLANNHSLDYGERGLRNTTDSCSKNNIRHVGAGMNRAEASEPLIIEREGLKIAFVNFCENEWSIATPQNAGANRMDTIDNLTQIREARRKADFVILIVHGGHEYYHLPSPRMVKQYRFYAENGADAVIGHHTHCISGYEVHQNVPIAYSLGNMLFTHSNNNIAWYTGLIAQLHIEKNKFIRLELIPSRQSQQSFMLSLLHDKEKEILLEQLSHLSDIIKNQDELEKLWNKFIQSKSATINLFSPVNTMPVRYFRAALNRLGFNQLFMKKRYLTSILNHVRCEAHRDVITEILKERISKK